MQRYSYTKELNPYNIEESPSTLDKLSYNVFKCEKSFVAPFGSVPILCKGTHNLFLLPPYCAKISCQIFISFLSLNFLFVLLSCFLNIMALYKSFNKDSVLVLSKTIAIDELR